VAISLLFTENTTQIFEVGMLHSLLAHLNVRAQHSDDVLRLIVSMGDGRR